MFDNKHSMNTTLIQPAMYAYSSYCRNCSIYNLNTYTNITIQGKYCVCVLACKCYIKPKDFIKYIGIVFTIHLLDFSPFVKIDGMMRLHSIE